MMPTLIVLEQCDVSTPGHVKSGEHGVEVALFKKWHLNAVFITFRFCMVVCVSAFTKVYVRLGLLC